MEIKMVSSKTSFPSLLHWGDNEKLDKGSFHTPFYTPETFWKKQVNQKEQ